MLTKEEIIDLIDVRIRNILESTIANYEKVKNSSEISIEGVLYVSKQISEQRSFLENLDAIINETRNTSEELMPIQNENITKILAVSSYKLYDSENFVKEFFEADVTG
jgi:hypothetical protein